MSEYWVSHKKYYCKYCEIYIADDAPSRTQHETGLRHQGGKERFIRNLYKNGEKKKRDEEEEKREITRIDQAANAAFANDVQSGRAKASTSSAPAVAAKSSASKSALSGGIYANYTTAKDLGIAQDEERMEMEALQLQQSQGVVGQWEVIESASSAPSHPILPQKRPFEDDEDEEGHGFRVQRRKLAEGLGEVYDPGKIVIVPKSGPGDKNEAEEKREDVLTQGQPKALKWSTKRWKVGGTGEGGGEEQVEEADTALNANKPPKEDIANKEGIAAPSLDIKTEAPLDEGHAEVVDNAPSKSMFKKRKAPSQPVGQKKGVRKQL